MTRTLVLVTGTGRSGTSTIAGALQLLGFQVPGPFLGANDSNPKGFYESRWAVRFHKRIVRAAGVHEFDSRPAAFDRVQQVLTPEHRQVVARFLEANALDHDVVVVKDPRSVWTQGLWKAAAQDVGMSICYVSMLRHPAEVVGSRTTYYANQAEEVARRRYEIFNVARWVNASLVSERGTRGEARSFVRYTDLIEDWRTELARVGAELSLKYPQPPEQGVPHPVDSFVDPGLRRHDASWDLLSVPEELRAVAEQVWATLGELRDAGGSSEPAEAQLDELSDRFATLFSQADALSHDATEEARAEASRRGHAEGLAEGLAEGRAEGRAAALEETSGRQLLGAAARRARSRLQSSRQER